MLSVEYKAKLNPFGIYRHKPDVELVDRLYEDDMYCCHNWTFRLIADGDNDFCFVDT